MKRGVFPVLAIACLAIAVCFAGCTGTTTAPNTTGQVKTYVVGIDGEYPPYSYVEPSGNVTGFDVDSIKWIAAKKGFKVTFQPTQWDGIIPALQAGKIDMVYSGMTITEERKQQVNFSIPYWKVNQSVAVHNDTNATLDDFKAGKLTVGGQRGTTGAMWAEDNLVKTGTMPAANLVTYDTFPLAATDLVNKRIQAAIYDTPPMKDAIDGKPLHIVGEIDTGEEYGVAIRKSDTELLLVVNEGLAELMKDPYWEALKTTYEME
ncbi:MAG: basic amino acid ABC transporter substrate-binding protein [Methanobacteriota archaeon]|nr:MAG: basic amino acid ABC transporter substrate-binding protein [Euryarchaeota archaeon]